MFFRYEQARAADIKAGRGGGRGGGGRGRGPGRWTAAAPSEEYRQSLFALGKPECMLSAVLSKASGRGKCCTESRALDSARRHDFSLHTASLARMASVDQTATRLWSYLLTLPSP